MERLDRNFTAFCEPTSFSNGFDHDVPKSILSLKSIDIPVSNDHHLQFLIFLHNRSDILIKMSY